MERIRFTSPDFPELASIGTMLVKTGTVWSFTLKVSHDGDGVLLESPRKLVIRLEVFNDD